MRQRQRRCEMMDLIDCGIYGVIREVTFQTMYLCWGYTIISLPGKAHRLAISQSTKPMA